MINKRHLEKTRVETIKGEKTPEETTPPHICFIEIKRTRLAYVRTTDSPFTVNEAKYKNSSPIEKFSFPLHQRDRQ